MLVRLVFIVAAASAQLQINNILDRAHCLAQCTHFNKNVTSTQVPCKCDGDLIKKDWKLNSGMELTKVQLLCREDSFFTINLSNSSLAYAVEIKKKTGKWEFANVVNTRLTTIHNLKPETAYKIRLWGVSKNGELYGPSISEWIQTLSSENKPLPVPWLKLTKFSMDHESYVAHITWNASKDLSCYYDFIWFGGDNMTLTQSEVRNPKSLYEIKINNLVYGSNYSVGVMATSSDYLRESEKTWLHFTTPKCYDARRNLTQCPPEEPVDLQMEELVNDNQTHHNVILTWQRPNVMPYYYLAHLLSYYPGRNGSSRFMNISGESTKATFGDIDTSYHYEISLIACTKLKCSSPALVHGQTSPKAIISTTPTTGVSRVFIVMLLPLVILCVVALIVSFIYHEFNKRHRQRKRHKYFEDLELKAMYIDSYVPTAVPTIKDQWEIESTNLKLDSFLGEGAFGIVHKGWYVHQKGTKEVAVKMLKDDPLIDEVRQFLQEIEIMKSVGSHPNIVSIIGCCTKEGGVSMRLIVEYCAKGNLLNYLHGIADNLATEYIDCLQSDTSSSYISSAINFTNKMYLMSPPVQCETVLIKDLLNIARQIAMGMEYLSSVRVVHRDLAARNVLVCANGMVKVSDFGLSRDVYRNNVYCKVGPGKLPIKWMAIESLTHQRYTTKSDVWSFGVTMWEIFTLGANPYPGVATEDFLQQLKRGYRMDRPNNCSSEVYELMRNCWNTVPKHRPAFTEIREQLDSILESTTEYINLDITAHLQPPPHYTDFVVKDIEAPPKSVATQERYVNQKL